MSKLQSLWTLFLGLFDGQSLGVTYKRLRTEAEMEDLKQEKIDQNESTLIDRAFRGLTNYRFK